METQEKAQRLLKPYSESLQRNEDNATYFFFDVPYAIAKKIPTGKPNVTLSDTYGDESPTMKRMLSLAKKFNGTLDGCIYNSRHYSKTDAQIIFHSLTLNVKSIEDRKKLKEEFGNGPQETVWERNKLSLSWIDAV